MLTAVQGKSMRQADYKTLVQTFQRAPRPVRVKLRPAITPKVSQNG
eukprot:COSAG01_NODE_1517_length_10050_cov_2.477640_2_plen_46_part_00